MAEWANDAREYLDGYLNQVAVLVREQGDDPDDIIDGLGDHIANEVEAGDSGPVTVGRLLPVLSELGTPVDVASVDIAALKLQPTRPSEPNSVLHAAPTVPRKTKWVVDKHEQPLLYTLLFALMLVAFGGAGFFLIFTLNLIVKFVVPELFYR